MNELQVLQTIKKINPWFVSNKVPEAQLESFRRRELPKILGTLSRTEMATLIIGARRVGKSVLMYQTIDYLLQKGIKGDKIFFIQGDNPLLIEAYSGKKFLYEILRIFEGFFLNREFSTLEDILYVFIDEAQNIPGWEMDIKSIIDLKYKIKFIVTGSSSSELKRGSQNPLAGRVDIQVLTPFSFSDFVRYQLQKENSEEFSGIIDKACADFSSALINGTHADAYEVSRKVIENTQKYKIKSKFEKYLYLGGFPKVLSNQEPTEVQKYLKDLMTTTISQDIMAQEDIREPQAFERLLVNLCLSAGKVISYKGLSEILGIDSRVVSRYLDYYAESHWVSISSPFYFHRRPDSVKSSKKVYIIDSGIINTLSFKDENEIIKDKTFLGQLVENVLYNHLLNYKEQYGSFQSQIPYWVDDKTGKEIDFIFEIKNKVIPIESKVKKLPENEELEIIARFMKDKASTKYGIITTEESLEIREKILLIPYYILALLL